MTEKLEKKLNELLGLKKQLEAIRAETPTTAGPSMVKRYQTRVLLMWVSYGLSCLFGIGFVILGLAALHIGLEEPPFQGVLSLDAPTCIIVGLLIVQFAKMFFLIRRNRLSVLQEMKHFELRITEMLKN